MSERWAVGTERGLEQEQLSHGVVSLRGILPSAQRVLPLGCLSSGPVPPVYRQGDRGSERRELAQGHMGWTHTLPIPWAHLSGPIKPGSGGPERIPCHGESPLSPPEEPGGSRARGVQQREGSPGWQVSETVWLPSSRPSSGWHQPHTAAELPRRQTWGHSDGALPQSTAPSPRWRHSV